MEPEKFTFVYKLSQNCVFSAPNFVLMEKNADMIIFKGDGATATCHNALMTKMQSQTESSTVQ